MRKDVATSFGFGSTILDKTFTIYHCKIMVQNPVLAPEIPGVNIIYRTKVRKGIQVNSYLLRYATMDYNLHQKLQKEIMLFLEQHAHNKVASKYNWIHDQYAPEEQKELEMELLEVPSWDDLPL